MILWVLKYWRLAVLAVSVIGAVGMMGYAYHRGGADKEAALQARAVLETMKTKGKLDEIRNMPYDVDDVVKRLRSGKF